MTSPLMLPAVALPLERLGAPRDIESEAVELRRLRAGFGLTQAQMAQVLEVSLPVYNRWERGARKAWLSALEAMRCWAREAGASRGKKKPRR